MDKELIVYHPDAGVCAALDAPLGREEDEAECLFFGA